MTTAKKQAKHPASLWIPIASAGSIPPREGRSVQIGEREIAIFNLGRQFLAIDNQCPHQGGPLCDGIVAGTTVVCPLHGWKVDLESGGIRNPDLPACVQTYPARVEQGIIHLELPASEADIAA